jgi:AmmeMemoRadiSam system protein A
LSDADGRLLLAVARDSVEAQVLRGERLETGKYPASARLLEPHGAFVTLRRGRELRGCIGQTRAVQSLIDTVRDNAVFAATRDPRFPAVRADELPGLRIEVSALCAGDEAGSPFRRVRSLSEIVLGKDGLCLLPAGRSSGGGLLLPQVPEEQGWDLEQFLLGLCRKAGAPEGAWKSPDYELYRFRAQVFEEEA